MGVETKNSVNLGTDLSVAGGGGGVQEMTAEKIVKDSKTNLLKRLTTPNTSNIGVTRPG